jgi:hypothetical protein
MRLAGEAQHTGDRDIGVADPLAEPPGRGDAIARLFQHLQHAPDLRLAAIDPDFRRLLAQHALVNKTDRLVAKPRRQRADLQCVATFRPAFRDHRFRGPDQFIEIIQDRRALDQRLAAIQHQRRHPPQRIEDCDLVAVAEGRPRPVLEGQAVEPQCNRCAADEGESYWPIRIMGLKRSGRGKLSESPPIYLR